MWKIIYSIYSSVKHNVYLSMTQTFLQQFPNPFQCKSTPAFHFLNPFICSNGALIVIDRPENACLHSVVSWGLIYNRCVRTKRGLKRAYATSQANVGIYKNKLDGNICVFSCKLWPMCTNVLETGKWRRRREVVILRVGCRWMEGWGGNEGSAMSDQLI